MNTKNPRIFLSKQKGLSKYQKCKRELHERLGTSCRARQILRSNRVSLIQSDLGVGYIRYPMERVIPSVIREKSDFPLSHDQFQPLMPTSFTFINGVGDTKEEVVVSNAQALPSVSRPASTDDAFNG